jgi:ascorbate-specific PTS system EIIC-type component UlaA
MSKPHLPFQNFRVPYHWLRNLESHPIWSEAQSTIQMLRDLQCHSTCSIAMAAKQYAILLFIVRLQIYILLIKKTKWRIILMTGHMKRGSLALRQASILFWTFPKFVQFISLELFENRFYFHFLALKGRGILFCKTFLNVFLSVS